MSASIQTNVHNGKIAINAGGNLTDKEGYLVKLADAGSEPEVLLPTAVTDLTLYVVEEGAAQDSDCEVLPLCDGDQVRLIANGTGSAGNVLILDAGSYGQVAALGANGTYFSPGLAEEDFVDGQHVKTRVFKRMQAFTV